MAGSSKLGKEEGRPGATCGSALRCFPFLSQGHEGKGGHKQQEQAGGAEQAGGCFLLLGFVFADGLAGGGGSV